ncbi:large ribosomal subunit protein uL2m [Mantella aurantiaca]
MYGSAALSPRSVMAIRCLSRALRSMTVTCLRPEPRPLPQVGSSHLMCRSFLISSSLNHFDVWEPPTKYTINPTGMRKTGGRDHTGRIRTHGVGGGDDGEEL